MADTRIETATPPLPSETRLHGVSSASSPTLSSSPTDRRNSIEWDASKVPPSRFQKRKGSIYAVPSSRDGHVDSNYNTKFHEKHRELWKSPDGSTTAAAGAPRSRSNSTANAAESNKE